MNREAEIYQRLKTLNNNYELARNRLANASYSDHLLRTISNRTHDLSYCGSEVYVRWERKDLSNIVEYDNASKKVLILIENIISEHREELVEFFDAEKEVSTIEHDIWELKKTLWPSICETYSDKKVYEPHEKKFSTNPFPNMSGVYFLWGEAGLEYIGQSVNFKHRLNSGHGIYRHNYHIAGTISIDGEARRLEAEAKLIEYLQPMYNKTYNKFYGQYSLLLSND